MLLDRDLLDQLVDDLGDADLVHDLYVAYQRELPGRIAAIEAAFEVRDTVGLARAAHGLRSPSATLGILGIAELCGAIEEAAERNDVDLEHMLDELRWAALHLDSALRQHWVTA